MRYCALVLAFGLFSCSENELSSSSNNPGVDTSEDLGQDTREDFVSNADDAAEDQPFGDQPSDEDNFPDETNEDPGSTVGFKSLVVYANGERLGYLMVVNPYTLHVWDEANRLIFQVNDATGYVAGYEPVEFSNADCSSPVGIFGGSCETRPNRRYIYPDGGDPFGISQPSGLYVETDPHVSSRYSRNTDGECIEGAAPVSICQMSLSSTRIIPTAFSLPITVEEE